MAGSEGPRMLWENLKGKKVKTSDGKQPEVHLHWNETADPGGARPNRA